MQMPETDPQILKLTDKIRLYKHRCVASLGYNLYEKAFDFLKSTVARGVQTEERRSGLVGILGQESIGFWAILDQILFYENLVRELQQDV
jgi:NIMA (never in mitosis gene a)-related kinase